jgi:hypothetical protein
MQELLIREISKNVQQNVRLKFMKQITHDIGLTRSKRCIHYLNDKIRFDALSKRPTYKFTLLETSNLIVLFR